MYFEPLKKENIPSSNRGHYKRYGKNYKLLVDFQESDAQCVEVKNYSHKNARVAQSCLMLSIKRYRFPFHVIVRKDRVFLTKEKL